MSKIDVTIKENKKLRQSTLLTRLESFEKQKYIVYEKFDC